jgi:hypothetical protein
MVAAGNIFSLSEELINCNFNESKEILLTPKEIEKKLNSNNEFKYNDVTNTKIHLGIEDQLIDDPRNIIYDSHYFELKELLW